MGKIDIIEELVKAIIKKIDHAPSERGYVANNFGQIHCREQFLWFDLADGTIEISNAPQGCVLSSYEERLIVKAINTPIIDNDLEVIDEEALDVIKAAWADGRATEARDIAYRLADEILEHAMSENIEWDANEITEIAPSFDTLDPKSKTFVADATAMINDSVDENLAMTANDIGSLVEMWLYDQID